MNKNTIYTLTIIALFSAAAPMSGSEKLLKSATAIEKFMVQTVAAMAIQNPTHTHTNNTNEAIYIHKSKDAEYSVAIEPTQVIISFISTLVSAPKILQQEWKLLPKSSRCTHFHLGNGKYMSLFTITASDI